MKKKEKKIALHHRIHHHIKKYVYNHVHKIFHIHHNFHHHILHMGELMIVTIMTLISGTWMFANLTGFSEELYRNNSIETATALLEAMENPSASLKKGNIISIRKMDTNVENTFAKGYCTYGAARISPEFFPYIDNNTQQRTRGGNAVDRCKNAADTGYKIGMTPSQGALIIYDAGGKFGVYGHVGKVMHYEKQLNKIIVRDMARVGKYTMSDRWEDTTTAQVKCYIYNNKNTTIEPTTVTPPVVTPPITVTPPVIEPTVVTHPVAPPNTVTPPTTEPTTVTPPVVTPPITVTPPVVTTPPITLNQGLNLSLDKISDIAKHFVSQNDFSFTLVTESPLHLGETAMLSLEIINKKTGKKYSGLLPFSFGIISTNDSLQSSVGNIKFVNEGKTDISILAQKLGTSTIIITMDNIKIGKFSLEVQ